LNAFGGKQSSVSAWINILDPAIQIFFRFRAAATLAKSDGGFLTRIATGVPAAAQVPEESNQDRE
jgi:hypothetical protein